MPSKFTEHPSEADNDQSLFLILDKDGNFSADKENLERLLKNKKFPIKIVRMDTNLDGSASQEGNNDDEPQFQLTVDEIVPDDEVNDQDDTDKQNESDKSNDKDKVNERDKSSETNKTSESSHTRNSNRTNDSQKTNDSSKTDETKEATEPKAPAADTDQRSSLVSSSLDILPSTSADSSNQDSADPFSEMNPEQLQRLEHALASEQAKLILGENVAVIRDMLSVDEFCGSFLQKSIENDHCYTNLLPSSDPNGPTPFSADVRVHMIENAVINKSTNGNSGMGNQQNVPVRDNSNPPDIHLPVDAPQVSNVEVHRGADDYEDDNVQPEVDPEPIPGPSYVADIHYEDISSESTQDEDDTSDEDYSDRGGKKRRKKTKKGKKVTTKKQAWSRGTTRPTARQARSTSRPRNWLEVQRMSEVSHPEMEEVTLPASTTGCRTDEDRPDPSKGKDSGKGPGKDKKTGPKKKRSREEGVGNEPKLAESGPGPGESASASASRPQPAKQPKKDSKKGHTQRPEALGPALFSTPDIIRRVPVAEDLPQATPEKKNFTAGLQKGILLKEGEGSRSAERKKSLTVTFQTGVSILREPPRPPPADQGKSKSLLKKPGTEILPKTSTEQPYIELVPLRDPESTPPPPRVQTFPKLKLGSTPKPRGGSSPKSRPGSSPKSKSKSDPKSSTETASVSKPESAPKSNTETASVSRPESTPRPNTETASVSGQESTPKPNTETAPEPKSPHFYKTKTDRSPKSKPGPSKQKAESAPKPKAESSPKSKAKAAPKAKAESSRRTKAESASKSKAKSAPQSETESAFQPGFEVVWQKKARSASKPKAKPKPRRRGDSAPQPEIVPAPEPQPEPERVPRPEAESTTRRKPQTSKARVVAECDSPPPVYDEDASLSCGTTYHIQRILDEHKRQQKESQSYRSDYRSDDPANENYELDPTQMDQSLLETVARRNYRTETRRLHEALILQEQEIGYPRDAEPRPRKSKAELSLDDSLRDVVDVILSELEAQELEINRNEERTLMARDPPRVELPSAEPPRIEPPRTEPQRVEPLRVELQSVEPQSVEAQSVEPQRAESQRAEPPRAESPRAGSPMIVSPRAESPIVDYPIEESPIVDYPIAESPRAESPVVISPRAESPMVVSPRAESPKPASPVADYPIEEAPRAGSSRAQANNEQRLRRAAEIFRNNDDLARPSTSGLRNNRAIEEYRIEEEDFSEYDSDMDDALSEASWNSEDDPDRLWCICRKPHNNRFMICCDSCEDWFHGKCVGITKSIGRQMEIDGLEWSCPKCILRRNGVNPDEDEEEEDDDDDEMDGLGEEDDEDGGGGANHGNPGDDQEYENDEEHHGNEHANPGHGPEPQGGSGANGGGAQEGADGGNEEDGEGGAGKERGNTPQTSNERKVKKDQESGKEKSVSCREEQSGSEDSDDNSDSDDDYFYQRQCIMCEVFVRDNSLYCGDECLKSHSQNAIAQLKEEASQPPDPEAAASDPFEEEEEEEGEEDDIEVTPENPRIIVMDTETRKVLSGRKAPTAANLLNWLRQNPSYQVVHKKSGTSGQYIATSPKMIRIARKRDMTPGDLEAWKLSLAKGSGVVRQIQVNIPVGRTGKLGKATRIITTTSRRQIYQIFSASPGSSFHPTTIIVRPKQSEGSNPSPAAVKSSAPKSGATATVVRASVAPKETGPPKGDKMSKKKKEKEKAPATGVTNKDVKQGLQKTEKEEEAEQEYVDADMKIRMNIRRSLGTSLKSRVRLNNLTHSDESVEELANEIEEQLFKCFEKVDSKYKSKYRSLFFNLKDQRNPTLFRKVLNGSITPSELVRLSPEELASPELARWREKENQHQLEMIKKSELELMTIGNTYIMKSHKGEQVIESADSERVAAVAAEIDPNTPAQDLVSALNSVAGTSAGQKKENDKDDGREKAPGAGVESEAEGLEEMELMQGDGMEELIREAKNIEEENEEGEESEEEDEVKEDKDKKEDGNDKDLELPTKGKKKGSGHEGSRGRQSRSKSPKKDRGRKRGRRGSRSSSDKYRSGSKRSRDEGRSRHSHKNKKSKTEKRESSNPRDSIESQDSRDARGSSNSRDSTDSSEDRNERNEKAKDRDGEKPRPKSPAQDADHEPSPIVVVKTPIITTEEPEPKPDSEPGPVSVSVPTPTQTLKPAPGQGLEPDPKPAPQAQPSYVWKGAIAMAEVAKFWATARKVSGNCEKLAADIGDKMEIVGRIPYETVWDYIVRMRKMATKDIILIKVIPTNESDKIGYATLFGYLSKRSRIGVVGRTVDVVKDFYLYPWDSRFPLPQALLSLSGHALDNERGKNLILGIIVRSKRRAPNQRSLSTEAHSSKTEPIKLPESSLIPPVTDEDKFKKDPRLKKKIRVQVDFNKPPAHDDGDSPYSPGDSDEDLAPLPKIPKLTTPDISAQLQKFLSTASNPENLKDPAEIQRKIEEMNRAIEEQTQQIQSLTSAVPMLTGNVPLPNISLISTPLLSNTSAGVSTIPHPIPSTPASLSAMKPSPEIEELPIKPAEQSERPRSPPRSFSPKEMEEKIPFLPEGQSTFTPPIRKEEEGGKKVTLPPNLQEILNSINKKSGAETSETKSLPNPAKAVEEIVKSNTPDINMALNVLTQTKSLLHSLSAISGSKESAEKPEETAPILSRLSDDDIIRKAKEMEALAHGEKDFSPSVVLPPLPIQPVVSDIPMRTSGDTYGFNLASTVFPHGVEDKSLMDMDERKQKKFRLDPKSVFEKEGVPDFMASTTSSWDDKQKQSRFKIDIKLSIPSPDRQNPDGESVEADNASTSKLDEEKKLNAPETSRNIADESKYDVDERVMKSKGEERPKGMQDDRRRRNEDWEGKRDWKYDRRNWDDQRRFNKGDYNRRHGGKPYGGPKYRKGRFDDKRDKHLEKEWEGSIKDFEERQRRRNMETRKEDGKRLGKHSDSTSN